MNSEEKIKNIIQKKTEIPKEVEEKIENMYSIIRNEGNSMKNRKSFKYKRISITATILICMGLFATVPTVRAGVLNILSLWSNENDRGIENALSSGIYQNIEGISTVSNGMGAEVITVFADSNRIGITMKLDIDKKIVLKDGNGGGFDYTITNNNGELIFAFARVEDSELKPYNPYGLYPIDKLYEVDGEYFYNILLSSTESIFENITSIEFESELLTLHERVGFNEHQGEWKLEIPIEQNKDKCIYSAIDAKDLVKVNKAVSTPYGFVIDYVLLNQNDYDERIVSDINIIDENGNEFVPRQGFGVTDTEVGPRVECFIESPFYNHPQTLIFHCTNGNGKIYAVTLKQD